MNYARPMTRRRRRAVSAVAIAAVLVPLGAFSAVGQMQAKDPQLQARQEFLAQPVVTEVSEAEKVVWIDVSKDPHGASEWLEESGEVMDGWTVRIAGLDVKSGPERAAQDAESAPRELAPAVAACPDIPTGPRSADGSTRPDLGCDLAAGERDKGALVRGNASRTLAVATDGVLASFLPDADLAPTKVRIAKGAATIDVAAGFEQALADAGVYPGDVWQALLFTAHSNGAVDSVKFTLDGDCLAFAYATGGDMCTATNLPIVLS